MLLAGISEGFRAVINRIDRIVVVFQNIRDRFGHGGLVFRVEKLHPVLLSSMKT